MTSEVAQALEGMGELLAAGGNRPFLLDDVESVWLVSSGKVDLFAVGACDGEAVGARHHLFRVEAGGLLFGVAPSGALALLAVGTTGSTVRRLPREWLRSREGSAWGAQIAGWTAQWCLGLSAALATETLPRAVQTLQPAAEASLEAGAAAAGEGLVWARALAGSACLLGRDDLPLSPEEDGLLPVSPATWVQAGTAGARLEVLDTAALVERGIAWGCLERFHALALGAIRGRLDAQAQAEAERLRRTAELGQSAMGGALGSLAAVMDAPAVGARPAEATRDALVRACRCIGDVLGVTIQAPVEMREGKGLKDPINDIARASGVRVRRVLLRGGWWEQDLGPLLAFRDGTHEPIALIPTASLRCEAVDPTAGARLPVTPEVAATLESFAYVFYAPLPRRVLKAIDLIRLGLRSCARRDRRMVPLTGLAGGVLGMVTPAATGIIMDTIIPDADRGQLLQMALCLFTIAFSTALFQLARGLAILRTETNMTSAVQAGLWDRLLGLPAPFFRRFSTGDLALRSLGIDQIRQALTGAALGSLFSSVFSIFSLAMLFFYHARLAWVAMALVLVAVLFTAVTSALQVRFEQAVQHIEGRLSALVLQLVTGVAKLRVAAAEERAFAAWAGEFAGKKRLAYQARTVSNVIATFNVVFPVVASMVILRVAANAVFKPETGDKALTTGAFLAFNGAFGQFLAAGIEMTGILTTLLRIVPLYQRAQPILEAAPEVEGDRSHPGHLSGDIEMSHVTFRYHPGGPVVLEDVSMRFRPGEFVAVVGPSGAGKSTLIRLLLGFEQPESGAVYYDGQVLESLDIHAVRRQMGIVLQNGQVTPGSVFDNIVGSAPLTVEDAMEAARMAGLDRDIKAMPMGLHTVITAGGGTLSGGQRQRLLIARAVVRRPRIILFDEATSALDNRTQAEVSRSLEGLQATRVVIAHRLSTVVNADRIYVMQAGRVVQSGTYADLMAQPGPFADLARPQMV